MNKHRASSQCLIIWGSPGRSHKSVSVCRGRFAFRKTLFSIALFSLCSLTKLRACKALTTARPLSASPPTGAQLASLISGANATHELLNIYQDYRDQLDARHVVQLWPRLAKRVTSENARATDRVHTWVVQHRVILGHLVSHCVKVHAH